VSLTISAARMNESGSWQLLREDDEILEQFLAAFEEFSSLGLQIDSDIRTGGLDRKMIVDELLHYCGGSRWIRPSDTANLAEILISENFNRSQFDVTRLSLTIFLRECARHELGVVLI
jgi:hypothetical protein